MNPSARRLVHRMPFLTAMATLVSLVPTLTGCGRQPAGPLVWQPPALHLRLLPGQATAPLTFSWRNPGPDDVHVSRVEADCDCLVVQVGGWTAPAGQVGEINLDFHAGDRVGRVDRTLRIFFADQSTPAELRIRVDIPELMRVQPRILVWERNGPSLTLPITVDSRGHPWKVLSARSSNRRFQIESRADGRLTRIEVTPDGTELPASSQLILETDCPHPPWNRIAIPLRIH